MVFLALGRSFESVLLILAALFLWITFFLVARSTSEIASSTFSFDFDFLAALMATSSLARMRLFTAIFFLEDRCALLAVLVTGMLLV